MAVEIDSIPNSKAIGWADARLTRLASGSIQVPNATINASGGAAGSGSIAFVDRGDVLIMYGTAFGVQPLRCQAPGGLLLETNASALSFGASADAQLHRDAANTLAQRNGANAQAFNLYNTYTDGSNYERGFMRWSSNVLEIGTEAAGTGAARQLRLDAASTGIQFRVGGTLIAEARSANFRPGLNDTFDLGASGRSWRDIYLSPSASLTPSANGDLCIEATNNTTLTFKYKGSDGTVRSGTVALS